VTTASVLVAETFKVEPYTAQCAVIYGEAAHAVIGVSPGNSYFTQERLHALASWGLARFHRVDFVYTDLCQAEMYEADGYSPDHARQKAVKNLRAVRGRVERTVEEAGSDRIAAHPLSSFRSNPAYALAHADVQQRLYRDPEFRTVCEALVSTFLAARTGKEASEQQRQVCMEYVCAEVPLFIDSPGIFGVPSSLNCYHQLLPLAELLYSRGSGLRASRNQGHAVITPVEGVAA
jgi:cyclo(L-tyrosyl-L-tyrosyl) synthase